MRGIKFRSFLKQQITSKTGDGGKKDVKVLVPLKCLSNLKCL